MCEEDEVLAASPLCETISSVTFSNNYCVGIMFAEIVELCSYMNSSVQLDTGFVCIAFLFELVLIT